MVMFAVWCLKACSATQYDTFVRLRPKITQQVKVIATVWQTTQVARKTSCQWLQIYCYAEGEREGVVAQSTESPLTTHLLHGSSEEVKYNLKWTLGGKERRWDEYSWRGQLHIDPKVHNTENKSARWIWGSTEPRVDRSKWQWNQGLMDYGWG